MMISNLLKKLYSRRVFSYWLFAIVGSVALVHLESVEDIEPMFSISGFLYFALLIFWGISWINKQIKSSLTQKKEKIALELKYLQSQINPHFLFNALNNLYGIVDKNSKEAKGYILKLSDLMRYSVYEGQIDRVNLSKEIAYLENYIYLHEIRYKKTVDVQFNKKIINEDQQVLPLLFISILENAFKHGVENLRADAYVYINLESTNTGLVFEVENNFDPELINEDKGEGLSNLKKRLKLAYPKKHKYSWSQNETIYKAQLKLEFDD